jgi:hypothetical protein
LREPLSTYYAGVSSVFDQSRLSVEQIQSPGLTEDIIVAHLLFKCITKAGYWQWQRSGRLGDEQTASAWVNRLFVNDALKLIFPNSDHRSFPTICVAIQVSGRAETPARNIDVPRKYEHFAFIGTINEAHVALWQILPKAVLFFTFKICRATSVRRARSFLLATGCRSHK